MTLRGEGWEPRGKGTSVTRQPRRDGKHRETYGENAGYVGGVQEAEMGEEVERRRQEVVTISSRLPPVGTETGNGERG